MNFKEKNIILKCLHYIEERDYKSYDVFDSLNSPLLNSFTKKSILLRRIAIQINAKLPLNIRPLLGVKKIVHTKAISDLLSIYSMLYKITNENEYKEKADQMFDILWKKRISIENGIGWGLGFPYATRFTNADSKTPNLYNTLNATNSIIEYYETFKSINLKEIIDSVLYFILEYLGVVKENESVSWLRYYPKQTGMPTPNVNATSVALFVKINNIFPGKIKHELIVELLNFVKKAQNKNGSWFYTTTDNGKWIDGFHTGFILESLVLIKKIEPSFDVNTMLDKGVDFFINKLIDTDGLPKFYDTSTYPIESQNCAQCIQTLAKLIINDNQKLEYRLENTLELVIQNLYDTKGYFYHKKEKFYKNKQYYSRWSQTPMIQSMLYSSIALKK